MRRTLLAGLALVTAAVAGPAIAAPGNGNGIGQGVGGGRGHHAVCSDTRAGYAHCLSHVVDRSGSDPTPNATGSPVGLDPATIKSVYGFPTGQNAGAGKTIAIVDAFHSATAEADLGTFSTAFGLPSCTKANLCFTQVNQTGGTSYPAVDQGWALEIALDVQWAHAIAPGAKILLVEATTNSYANLLAAEDYAAAHAQYVSNSWGSAEFSGETTLDSHFTRAGVSFFVSAGDNGTPAEYPSSSAAVISVGGTTLSGIGTAGFTETAWSDGGGGCSLYEAATAAQKAFAGYAQAGCGTTRATPDVSLDADPNSGVAVYDSTPYLGQSGWFQLGGTSASAPMWAARSAVAGALVNSAYVYGRDPSTFRDVTSGNNGAACLVGFDLCSGRGSWVDAQTAADFAVTLTPASRSTSPSGVVTFTATVTPSNGFTGDVGLAVSGVNATFAPATITGGSGSSTLTVTAPATAGTSPFTVTATSGSLSHSASGSVTVVSPDFSLSLSPTSANVVRGRSTTSTVSVATTAGFSGAVSLKASSAPGVTTSFAPSSVSPTPGSSVLTLTVGPSAAVGNRTITVTGTDAANRTRTATFTLNVKKK